LLLLLAVCAAAVQCACALEPAGSFRGAKAGRLPGQGFKPHTYRKEGDLHIQSFVSEALPLMPGEVAFTQPMSTLLTFPPGPIRIKSFRAEVVDANGTSVPLYEAYNHHWIVIKNMGDNNLGPCAQNLPHVFGVGEECRNTFVDFEEPFRLFADGTEKWHANIHVIRTVDTPYVKECIECHCGDINDPYNGGGFSCCQDGSRCPTTGNDTAAKDYFLKYTLYWNDPDPSYIPIDVYVFDASDCAVEYNIPPCANPETGCLDTMSETYTLEYDTTVIYAVGHIHPGSINITLGIDGQDPFCVSRAHYGNGTQAGNENGYVVALDSCTFDPPLKIPAGTTLRYTAIYNSTIFHDAVMALFYMAVVSDSPQPQLRALNMNVL